MPQLPEKLIEQVVQALREQLGENLFSCCLYGSAIRGNFVEGQSDINLLIVVGVSNPVAHESIAQAIGDHGMIDPFIIARPGLVRSVRSFAPKFASIKRNYRVIYGADPLAELEIDTTQERFLCEQALLNLHLRMTFAFVTRHRNKSYRRFLVRSITPLFIQFSEVLRLEGVGVPKEFEPRIGLFERHFSIKGDILRDLLVLRTDPNQQGMEFDECWHERLFPVVDSVVNWVANHWGKA